MAGLEASLSAAEITPIPGLQFRLPSVSPYITLRQEIYFTPAGQIFSPSTNRVLRINASGNGFADLSTAILEFTVANNSTTHALQPVSANGSCFFSEFRFLLSELRRNGLEEVGGGLLIRPYHGGTPERNPSFKTCRGSGRWLWDQD